jgi:hypothetical protein
MFYILYIFHNNLMFNSTELCLYESTSIHILNNKNTLSLSGKSLKKIYDASYHE